MRAAWPWPACWRRSPLGVAPVPGTADVDPARVTTAVLDQPTIDRMARDVALTSITRGTTLALLGLLCALSVAVQLTDDPGLRLVVPAVTVLLVVGTLTSGYLRVRTLLGRASSGELTLTFGADGFVSTSAAGTGQTRYADVAQVTERGETVLLKGRGGLVSIYPRSLFPPALLDEVRAGVRGGTSSTGSG